MRGETRELPLPALPVPDNGAPARLPGLGREHAERRRAAPVEIRYAPELGLLSPLARQLVPKLSFWFDPRAPYGWIAHRLPLYTGGPEVLVVRQGISTAMLAN